MTNFLKIARRHARRGVTIIWVAVTMVALLGFCSLAVDLGRVQAVKSQLEVATDAAARAAAANLSSGVSAVQGAAYSVAQANTADGSPVAIDSINNVTFLNWPSTTPLTGAARSSANAVQINASLTVPLLFAQAIGFPTATVHARSTAKAVTTAPATYQILALNSATFTGGSTNSYNSSLGSYSSQTPGSQGSIASNGSITVDAGSTINGSVYYAGSTAPTIGSVGGVCTGSTTYVGPTPLSAATPVAPPGATSLGNVNITYAALNQTVTAGNFTCTGITVDTGTTLTINAAAGPVNIYCSGPVTGNGGNIAVTGNLPSNFHLYVTNSSTVQLNSGSHWYMVIDAPLSNVNLTATSDLYGAVICNNLTVDAGTNVHFDQALGTNGTGSGAGTTTISQVQ